MTEDDTGLPERDVPLSEDKQWSDILGVTAQTAGELELAFPVVAGVEDTLLPGDGECAAIGKRGAADGKPAEDDNWQGAGCRSPELDVELVRETADGSGYTTATLVAGSKVTACV